MHINREHEYEHWQDAHITFNEEISTYTCWDESEQFLYECDTRMEARSRLHDYSVHLEEIGCSSNNG